MSAECRRSCQFVTTRQAKIDELEMYRGYVCDAYTGIAGLWDIGPEAAMQEISEVGIETAAIKHAGNSQELLVPFLAANEALANKYYETLEILDDGVEWRQKDIDAAESSCIEPLRLRRYGVFGPEVGICTAGLKNIFPRLRKQP
ncbi:MAG TPA: hypothetical protein VF572_05185 [Candidatus Saccharimonadales bacterium]|jgi:hypothetical protein